MPSETLNTGSNEAARQDEMISRTSDIVSAYVGNNAVATSDLPGLIEPVYSTLSKVGSPAQPEVQQDPAVPIRRSVKSELGIVYSGLFRLALDGDALAFLLSGASPCGTDWAP